MSRIHLGFALLVSACVSVVAVSARASAAERVPMIVVLHEDRVASGREIGVAALVEALPGLPDVLNLAYVDAGVVDTVRRLAARFGFLPTRIYGAALAGFAADLTPEQASALERDAHVDYVEIDGTMQAIAQTLPYGIDRVEADLSSTRAGDGIGAITNVNAYVIDTGIDRDHPDLNVVNHVTFVPAGLLGFLFPEPNEDCNGHGTEVAGVIAARDNNREVVGVAPGAPLTGVKVLGCNGSGSTSQVIQGVDWVTANARRPAIANMSLGGGVSQALDDAVRRSAASGIFYAVAAGNDGANACNSSPARAGAGTNGIMTVAATDAADSEASFSNYGACVDVWAPGVNILSTRNGGGTATASGTSFSSPHVGGGGALVLSRSPASSPDAVETALKSSAATPGSRSRDGRIIQRLDVRSF